MTTRPAGLRQRSFWVWVGVAVLCTVLMWALPGNETVPYHIAWATFAVCFGHEVWSRATTWTGLGLFTIATGAVLVMRVAQGVLDWQEAAEIPLMLLLMTLMVRHVRRSQAAVAALTTVHERERREAHSRDLLTRRTSHEMRSPLTIARGYVEVLEERHRGSESSVELAVVGDELKRLTRVCDRLVRSMRAQQELEMERVDLEDLLTRTCNAWSPVARRHWVVSVSAGSHRCSSERLRACLDTLVENAIRYTGPGDTIELFAVRSTDGWTSVGVADSGPGFSTGVHEAVLAVAARSGRGPDYGVAAGLASEDRLAAHPDQVLEAFGDELSQTGLGLGMVQDAVTRRGGRLEISRSRWGGALVGMAWPPDGE